jgi:ribosomal protein L9
MEVILKEDVANLGLRGEVVKVADGFGRNYLLPRKLAMQATAANKAVIEQMKASAERRLPLKRFTQRSCSPSSSPSCSALPARRENRAISLAP